MAVQNCQYMVQITERIQVIRLYCFRYAVDDCTGFHIIATADQLLCMFMWAEAVVGSFCCVVIVWVNIPVR